MCGQFPEVEIIWDALAHEQNQILDKQVMVYHWLDKMNAAGWNEVMMHLSNTEESSGKQCLRSFMTMSLAIVVYTESKNQKTHPLAMSSDRASTYV